MKLAIFGAFVAAAGLALGVDGLMYSGGLWFVSGLLITAILAARKGESGASASGLILHNEAEIGRIEGSAGQDRPGTWPGFVLTLTIGLGSLALGIFSVGFTGEYEVLRWLPIAVGALITFVVVITLPARLGAMDPQALAEMERTLAAKTIDEPVSSKSGGGRKARLEELEELRRADLITQGEYETQRQRILGSI